MQRIESVHARIGAAGSLPELLTAGWDAFTLVLDSCHAAEGHSSEWFAALAFAGAAASRGRLLLASAPSLPISERSQTRHGAAVKHDLDQVAAGLASLSRLLHDRLWHAAADAVDAGDREACLDAAAYAGQAAGLLARDR